MLTMGVYIGCVVGLWLLCKLARSYVVKSPFANIPGPKSSSFVFGNLYDLFSTDSWGLHAKVARYGGVSSITGMFGAQRLYIYDPAALYSIFMKDHESWDLDAWILHSNRMLLGPGLLSVQGDMHQKQRKMLSAVFSIKHLRNMTPILHGVAHNLVNAISARIEGDASPVDVFTWMGRAALEMIGQSGLGYSFDPLVEDVPDEYAKALKNYIPCSSSAFMQSLRQLAPFVHNLGTGWLRRKALEMIPSAELRRLTQIVDTLDAKSKQIFEAKKRAIIQNGGLNEGQDIMSVLLKANMEADEAERLPEDQLVAQMSSILFAAMDTTSVALARTLQLLSEHPEAQERLRQELQDASQGEELEYDRLHGLPYLDAVCRETLRLHSPVLVSFREALKDTVLPLSEPLRGNDGAMIEEIIVPRGTNTIIGVQASNRNKAVWGQDAEEWKPERWLQPMPTTLERARIPGVYSKLMTFLGGSRACIGFKLSQLEMKLVLSALVQNFAFERGNVPIFWRVAMANYPSTSLESAKPEMWLTVRKLR